MPDESKDGVSVWQKIAATITGLAALATAISVAAPEFRHAWKKIFPPSSEAKAGGSSVSTDASNVVGSNISVSDAIIVSPVIKPPVRVTTVQPPPDAQPGIEPDTEFKRDTARVESCGVDEAAVQQYTDQLFREGLDAEVAADYKTLPKIMVPRNTIFYYDDTALGRARSTAEALHQVAKKSFAVQKGAGYSVQNKRHYFFVNLYGDDCGYWPEQKGDMVKVVGPDGNPQNF